MPNLINKIRYMVFDTETGGTDATKNDILQLSYQVRERENGNDVVISSVNLFFDYPEDETRVCEGAIRVNGLTKEVLAEHGTISRKEGIEKFFADALTCDYFVAHNGNFDKKFIEQTAIREGVEIPDNVFTILIDTMKLTTNLVKIKSKWGYKFPKLSELANFLNIDYSDLSLHDSMADVELTARCFNKLKAEYRDIFFEV